MMSQSDRQQFWNAYLRMYAEHELGLHMRNTHEVAAAFIARHGFEPEEAEVVTTFDEATTTWRSHIERRKHGSQAMPGMPRGRTGPIG